MKRWGIILLSIFVVVYIFSIIAGFLTNSLSGSVIITVAEDSNHPVSKLPISEGLNSTQFYKVNTPPGSEWLTIIVLRCVPGIIYAEPNSRIQIPDCNLGPC